jgi:hypothetical protein
MPEQNSNSIDAHIVESMPWPAKSIFDYTKIEDGDWGTLIQYSDGRFYFDQTNIPKKDAILKRWGNRFVNAGST